MADKTFIWHGPPTTIEVVRHGTAEVIFSGLAVTGQPIRQALPEDHDQVKGWLAFGLIKEAEMPTRTAKKHATKENTDG